MLRLLTLLAVIVNTISAQTDYALVYGDDGTQAYVSIYDRATLSEQAIFPLPGSDSGISSDNLDKLMVVDNINHIGYVQWWDNPNWVSKIMAIDLVNKTHIRTFSPPTPHPVY